MRGLNIKLRPNRGTTAPREPLYRLPEIADKLNAGVQTCKNIISRHRIEPAFRHKTGHVYRLSDFTSALNKEQ